MTDHINRRLKLESIIQHDWGCHRFHIVPSIHKKRFRTADGFEEPVKISERRCKRRRPWSPSSLSVRQRLGCAGSQAQKCGFKRLSSGRYHFRSGTRKAVTQVKQLHRDESPLHLHLRETGIERAAGLWSESWEASCLRFGGRRSFWTPSNAASRII
ncbi:hypothetical protein SKAU_G00099780 [Synaphobranchus kaupii]|uniref:Uncharacterized protein n=1 Tax=Synaphobranchus kaupii TaxID=118154 RepID=A0A9Q1FYA7_SYNKA|nr:hypothetical protein SKAU_G00099780 [Synaphobranchus kaupii]